MTITTTTHTGRGYSVRTQVDTGTRIVTVYTDTSGDYASPWVCVHVGRLNSDATDNTLRTLGAPDALGAAYNNIGR